MPKLLKINLDENRIVNIYSYIDNPSSDEQKKIDKYVKKLITLLEVNQYAKFFKILNIYFKDKKKLYKAVISLDKKQGKYSIFLNPFEEFDQAGIIHELVHLYEEEKSKAVSKFREIEKDIIKLNKKKSNHWALQLKISIERLFHEIILEGLARYIEYLESNKISLNKKIVLHKINDARTLASTINTTLESIFYEMQTGNKSKEELLRLSSYKYISSKINYTRDIGYILILSIMTFDMIFIFDDIFILLEAGYDKVIEKHESIMHSISKPPILSLKSNKGALDLLDLLMRITKLKKKISY